MAKNKNKNKLIRNGLGQVCFFLCKMMLVIMHVVEIKHDNAGKVLSTLTGM